MKVDLVMWTHNSSKTLGMVLKRIEKVIPKEVVHNKIIIDDFSVDNTRDIAKSFGWNVCFKEGKRGNIGDSANTALKLVETEYFISFEHDLLLAEDWWQKIPGYMIDENVAVAQGIRLSSEPTLRVLDEYSYSRLNPEKATQFGVSIDNNIYRTSIIKRLGGFPNDCPICTDTILMKKIVKETPYKWIIDNSVVSLHIRKNVREHLKHAYHLSKRCTSTHYCAGSKHVSCKMIRLFLTSPIRACTVAYRKRWLRVLYVYPLIRYYKMRASIEKTFGR